MKNLYSLLGIRRGASSRSIRDAYRRKAKEHHPDRSGEPGGDRFREIREAYEVLSDPGQRRDYDRALDTQDAPRPAGRTWAGPGPEPLKPGPGARDGGRVLDYTLYLSRAEAARGGSVSLDVPLGRVCPYCRGSGARGGWVCPGCQGAGQTARLARFSLRVPPGLNDGDMLTLDLGAAGLHQAVLRVRAVITPEFW